MGNAIEMVCEVFGPLSALVGIAGVVGLAVSAARALIASDGEVSAALASQAFRVCGLLAAMGAFGTLSSWLLARFGGVNVRAASVLAALLGGF